MNIDEFIQRFADAIETAADNLRPDTEFKKLDIWDSLNALSLIAMADADFKVSLTGKDIESSTTVADLFAIVQSKAK